MCKLTIRLRSLIFLIFVQNRVMYLWPIRKIWVDLTST